MGLCALIFSFFDDKFFLLRFAVFAIQAVLLKLFDISKEFVLFFCALLRVIRTLQNDLKVGCWLNNKLTLASIRTDILNVFLTGNTLQTVYYLAFFASHRSQRSTVANQALKLMIIVLGHVSNGS